MTGELAAGQLIANRYRLDRLLGEGGMGAVWAATHVITKKSVALKFLKGEVASRPEIVKRFVREARAASAVRHPNVVQIHDLLTLDDGVPVMVMDLLQGESLGEKIAREHSVPLSELARILVPVVSAIGTAHAMGIVHRDLKPDNIFLERVADSLIPKVLDFGIAKLSATDGQAAQTALLTQTGAMLGTPYYMAPEQAFGEKDVDHRVDIWALGIILYECLAGKRPVDGENLGQIFRVLMTGEIVPLDRVAPHLPQDITGLVTRMLALKREARAQDLREVFALLRRYSDVNAESFAGACSSGIALNHAAAVSIDSNLELAHTESVGALSRSAAPVARSRAAKALVGGVAVLLLVSASVIVVQKVRPKRSDLLPASAVGAPSSTLVAPPPSSSDTTEPLAASTAPSTSASTVASTSAPPKASTSRIPAKSGPGKDTGATATSTATQPPAPTPATTPTKLPGGVVGAAPF